jgi:hypothetical protein
MLSDSSARSRAVKNLTASLSQSRRLPRSDASVFTEYILPVITDVKSFDLINFGRKPTVVLLPQLAQDAPVWFRCTVDPAICCRISGNCSNIPRVVPLAKSHHVERDDADNQISWQQCQ